MKNLFTLIVLILLSAQLFAQRGDREGGGQGQMNRQQQTKVPLPPPLPSRDVSGIVKDESGQTVIGALVTLKSKSDTMSVSTNADGVFILKGVKQNTFNITVKSLGSKLFVQKYAFSDTKKNVVLDPIVLKTESNQLATVNINGTPSVTYKEDTVEYRASDYKVRENATLDELLKKMEGMEVGTDGSLTHQGQQVVKAKLNGKEYAGGSVAQAIQNLPADIIEKVQIVDDYGDQAARTGIKDGDPQKVLNVTTKADRSVGTTGRLTTQYGSDDRYNAQLFIQRINANQQLGIIGGLRNTVNGVASTGIQGGATNDGGGGTGVGANARGGSGSGGSPGTTRSGSPSFNYRDQWSKNVQVVGSYAYNFSDNNAINDSYGQRYTSHGTSDFKSNSTSENDSKSHTFHYELDFNLDSANYLQVNPSFTYSSATSFNNIYSDNINNYDTGFEHVVNKGTNSNLNTSSSYGMTAFYLHLFKKPKRNFSIQLGVTRTTAKANGEQNTHFLNYPDSTQNGTPVDSLAHVLNNRTNTTTNYQATVTYVEPLSKFSLLEFSGNLSQRNNSSVSLQDTVSANGTVYPVASYSSIYNYDVTDTRATVDYRYAGTKVNVSIGAAAVPFWLDGTKLNAAVGENASTSRYDFRIIPAFRFAYSWSRTERFTLNYTGRNQEPSFTQIQPFTDRSNPTNIVIGNPNLKPSFTNTLTAQYNNYFANSKFNLSFGITASEIDNSIAQNTIQTAIPIHIDSLNSHNNSYKNIYTTKYENINGAKSIVGRYSISKQSNERTVNLALNGNVSYTYTPAKSNDQLYHQTTWRFDERFGPRINPNDNIEINPFIGYDISRSFTTLLNAQSNQLQTTSLGISGRMYFLKTWQINYDATKKYITGISGGNTTPLILNAGFEKEFLAKRNLVLTFNVYDILHQNNYIQQTVTSTGVTNTLSNTLSRYFMVGLRINLQKWSGTPQRNGRNMQRRGDGSFIY
ncbi:outer membrane beta-barrel protein [Mucilaginibacter corticis]|uniref:Outer membrane beta-barrel protein n=1 Tax=Mucilaginibacter corticis TaxID=2597670 RepID=A0A556MU93_9SPHI|nr:TonB-dependent receptor [Mucilaginibacter corticis]TSJ43463.1 outer membrane beta-barrel protein [Mucilaginibacter corticis]